MFLCVRLGVCLRACVTKVCAAFVFMRACRCVLVCVYCYCYNIISGSGSGSGSGSDSGNGSGSGNSRVAVFFGQRACQSACQFEKNID